jgi:diacylglycerol O-acyltransferase
VSIVQVSPVDATWLLLESRETPMHVGCLMEFTLPPDAPADYLRRQLDRMRAAHTLPPPWNLRPLDAPLIGARLPLLQTVRDVDLDFHVRHSALPHPGGQRELGILVSRLHSHQLDLQRPLWEVHLIEGLEGDRFAIYLKIHHTLIDGVSGMRMTLRALSSSPDDLNTPAFWTVGPDTRSDHAAGDSQGLLGRALSIAREGAATVSGLSRTTLDLAGAALSNGPLQAPFTAPTSALGGRIGGARRFATQQFELKSVKALAKAGDCTLNDIVLYLCGTALRRYLSEHARLPARTLTAGIPVSLREADDNRTGTAIGMIIADLGTNIGDARERLAVIKASTAAAKRNFRALPREALAAQAVVINGPYIAALIAGLGGHTPVPFSVGVSNVPGPSDPLYLSGARLDAIFPVSLLIHGNALNITCVSYAKTLNFGLIGARDTLPHLQRLAIYLADAADELSRALRAHNGRSGASRRKSAASSRKSAASSRKSAAARG